VIWVSAIVVVFVLGGIFFVSTREPSAQAGDLAQQVVSEPGKDKSSVSELLKDSGDAQKEEKKKKKRRKKKAEKPPAEPEKDVDEAPIEKVEVAEVPEPEDVPAAEEEELDASDLSEELLVELAAGLTGENAEPNAATPVTATGIGGRLSLPSGSTRRNYAGTFSLEIQGQLGGMGLRPDDAQTWNRLAHFLRAEAGTAYDLAKVQSPESMDTPFRIVLTARASMGAGIRFRSIKIADKYQCRINCTILQLQDGQYKTIDGTAASEYFTPSTAKRISRGEMLRKAYDITLESVVKKLNHLAIFRRRA
jgi:hypothetical protein